MVKKRCGQCGLVNWPGVMECARCGAFVDDLRQAVEPIRDTGGAAEFNNLKALGITAAVLTVVGLVGYSVLWSGTPVPQRAVEPKPGYSVIADFQNKERQRVADARQTANAQADTPYWNDPANPQSSKRMSEELKERVNNCPTRYLKTDPFGNKTCTFP